MHFVGHFSPATMTCHTKAIEYEITQKTRIIKNFLKKTKPLGKLKTRYRTITSESKCEKRSELTSNDKEMET